MVGGGDGKEPIIRWKGVIKEVLLIYDNYIYKCT